MRANSQRLPGRVRDHRLTQRLTELARFGAVGGLAFVVDVGIYNLLRATVLEDKPIGAKVISVAVAVMVAWIGNRCWTFRSSRQQQPLRELVLFGATNVVGLLIASACLFVSHYVLGLDSRLADNISGNGVGLVLGTLFRYVAYKHLVFTGGTGAAGPHDAAVPHEAATPHEAVGAAHRTPVTTTAARVGAALVLAAGAVVGTVGVAEIAHAADPAAATSQRTTTGTGTVPAQDSDPLLTPDPDSPDVGETETPAEPPGAPNREVEQDESDAAVTTGASPVVIGGYVFLGVVALGLTGIALTTLWWMLHAWRSETSLRRTGFVRTDTPPQRSFTLLVPGRHEEAVLAHTLERLVEQDHPDVEIIAIVGDDDPGTAAVARSVAERFPDRVRVVVDDSVPKNKPKALNRALQTARGDVVGVFDAEDEVHPHLLTLVDERFVTTGADVVQGGVQLMNHDTSWWSLRNVLEYYFWFRSRLHFHAEQRFIPLGGNTVFISTDRLRAAGGWDAECLAEDCEIGVRLSSEGAKVVVAYDPDVVTREETPGTLTSLFKQRTRWDQGFLQVLRKGEWRKLPTRGQRMFARYMLAMPFLQAFTGLLIPVSLALILFVKVPTEVALLTFLPIAPTLVILSVEVAGLGEFGRAYGRKIRVRDYVRLVLGTFPYQVFLAAAAIRSVVREMRGDNSWEKTEHAGAHIESRVEADVVVEGPVEVSGEEPAVVEPETEPETEAQGAPVVPTRAAATASLPDADETPTGEIAVGAPGYGSEHRRSGDRAGSSSGEQQHSSGDESRGRQRRPVREPVAAATVTDRHREAIR